MVVEKCLTVSEVMIMAIDLFFPNEKSSKGEASNFGTKIQNSSHIVIDENTIIQLLYETTKVKMLRLYLSTFVSSKVVPLSSVVYTAAQTYLPPKTLKSVTVPEAKPVDIVSEDESDLSILDKSEVTFRQNQIILVSQTHTTVSVMTPVQCRDVLMIDPAVENAMLDKTISDTRLCGASTPDPTFIEVNDDEGSLF